ncbi:hypothetical protein M405DRAFT_881720 [Rhizopogon salebrosus TDB-379]|nr:hypothetical protein M405DRAFT_886222 [Rhizopogon salebrosus TDB-379]KAJ8589209.1 hypothetical protein M405DRAFT_881720 [Rhizopogon salebrosus TDB-379]
MCAYAVLVLKTYHRDGSYLCTGPISSVSYSTRLTIRLRMPLRPTPTTSATRSTGRSSSASVEVDAGKSHQ